MSSSLKNGLRLPLLIRYLIWLFCSVGNLKPKLEPFFNLKLLLNLFLLTRPQMDNGNKMSAPPGEDEKPESDKKLDSGNE